MKNIVLILIFLLSASSIFSQTYIAQVKPAGSKTWGYVDGTGKMIIEPIYKKCVAFSESGNALFYEKKNGYKIIDTEGNITTPEITDFRIKELFGFGPKGFSHERLAIRSEDTWGFMDTEGKIIIKPKYTKVNVFSENLATVQIDGSQYIIDTEGNETSVEMPGLVEIRDFSEGLAPFKMESGFFGFLNPKGEVIIKAQYKGVGYFKDGLAWAKNASGLSGYIDKEGEWVIKPQFQTTKNFDPKSQLARIKVNDRWGYTTKSGDVMYVTTSTKWENFNEGLAVGRAADSFGYFNPEGNWAIEPKFEAVRKFKNGFAAAKSGGLWGYINYSGEWVIDPQFISVKDFALVK